ncbi:MAG: hypothetical protein QOJ37_1275, partial [Pseudonocardiales bacterium]|nr:hypothetical protein [Pseudonocardiales bacterium]
VEDEVGFDVPGHVAHPLIVGDGRGCDDHIRA